MKNRYEITRGDTRGIRHHGELSWTVVHVNNGTTEVVAAFHSRAYAEEFATSMQASLDRNAAVANMRRNPIFAPVKHMFCGLPVTVTQDAPVDSIVLHPDVLDTIEKRVFAWVEPEIIHAEKP
jgi:hypothetical protein